MGNKKLIVGVLCAASVASCSVHEADVRETEIKPVFYASIEQPSEEGGTRVYVDQDYKVLWDEGDEVSIFNLKDANDEYRFTGNTGDTGGSFELVKDFSEEGVSIDHRYAVYPYSQSTSIDTKGVLSVELPATQHYREHSFGSGANLMVAATDNKEFQFKNVCGYLVLKLYGEGVSVSSITLKGNNGEKLAGKASVTMPVDGLPSIEMANDASTEITLSCDTPVQLGATSEESMQFWFVVPPVTFNKGFTVSILEASGGSFYIETSKSITIERSHLTKMSAKEVDYVSPSIPIPEAVDLGLSVKWASFNLGASTPEGYGDYYAWGETEPYYKSLDPLIWKDGYEDGYTWLNYKWSIDSQFTLTKYCDNSSFGYDGFTDGLTILTLEDDAANVALAGNWRMPTLNEWTELLDNCSKTWTKENRVNGRRFTSKKNGNSIFLPAAGSFGDTNLRYPRTYGVYWSSSMAKDVPCNGRPLIFDSSEAAVYGKFSSRFGGFSIRPVYGDIIHVASVSLDKTEFELAVGETIVLEATVLPINAAEKGISWSSNNTSVATVSSTGVVTGVAVGSAIVTVTTTDGGKAATCNVTVTEASISIPEAVDLGLSVKWAAFNLGASKPEEYGDYYAWGESEPYYSSLDPLTWKEGKVDGYDWPSYLWCTGAGDLLTKYCPDPSYGYNGFTDGKSILDLADDAAYVNLGGDWRMPMDAEWTELRENCTWTWTTVNGVNGYQVCASNGNSIFLPAAGSRVSTGLGSVGSYCIYWSSSLYASSPDNVWGVYFDSGVVFKSYYLRCDGHSFRPIYGRFISVESVSLDKTEFKLAVGETTVLEATVLPINAVEKGISWSSNNTSVATVSSTGVVTGVAVGSAIITVTTTDGGKTATCNVTVTEASISVSGAVDLGLSVKWASLNLGASTPEEYGDYYAWGEIEPYYSSLDPPTWKEGKESGYAWSSYKWCMGDWNTVTKYCNNAESGYNGFTDTKTVLDPEDDAAHVKLGGKWRIPTSSEVDELIYTRYNSHYQWEWKSINGHNGWLVTYLVNNNSIFLPAAGFWDGTSYTAGSLVYCWSSSLTTSSSYRAWFMFLHSGSVSRDYLLFRYFGLSIRPVYAE